MSNYLGVLTDDAVRQILAPLAFDAVPTEGGTVTLPQKGQDMIVNLNPAANLTAMTLVLPNEANSTMGQRIFVSSTRQITTMTATGIATVNNAQTTFSAGDNYVFFKNKPNVWSRLIG